MKRFLAILPVLLLTLACTHGVDIQGDGTVFALNDQARSCSPDTAPCTFSVPQEYVEDYLALPAAGQRFVGWELCGEEQSSMCSYNIPAHVVERYHGDTFPPVVALFDTVSSREFEGVFDGVYSSLGELHPIRCIAVPDGHLACRVRHVSDNSLLSVINLEVELSPAGSGTVASNGWQISGGQGFEYWEPSGFAAFALTEVNGAYRGRQSMEFQFNSGGDSVTIVLNDYVSFYDVALPFRSFAEAQLLPLSNTNSNITHSFDTLGNYQINYGDCELNAQFTQVATGINTYAITAQSTCPADADTYTGFGFSKLSAQDGFLDQEMVLFPQQNGRAIWLRPEGDVEQANITFSN